jgi:hypothetical protein
VKGGVVAVSDGYAPGAGRFLCDLYFVRPKFHNVLAVTETLGADEEVYDREN